VRGENGQLGEALEGGAGACWVLWGVLGGSGANVLGCRKMALEVCGWRRKRARDQVEETRVLSKVWRVALVSFVAGLPSANTCTWGLHSPVVTD
jgi:hypothetical protein